MCITAGYGNSQNKYQIGNHYLFAVFQISDKTMSECFQMSKGLLQVIQSFFICNSWIFSILHLILRMLFSWLLRKMFDCLNSFLSHFYPGFNRQLKEIAQYLIIIILMYTLLFVLKQCLEVHCSTVVH